ncbi:dUTP diphosphatase [uncultured Clostridium sp.]|uniref:dUTP diphosphatase n=1 Tax=uncultured Clostridium sp. TaxID=59620 RepID=UPI0026F2CA19|nr:dUTP diphosphatase [uncultured Clostridium sp.]
MIKFEYVERIKKDCNFQSEGWKMSLPQRSTKKSAGYDFINPETVTIQSKEIVYVKTGVKALFPDDFVLKLYNRSSNPKKLGLVLINGVGIIDADYYNNPDNEGEIAFAFMNIKDEPVTLEYGCKLGQGIFEKYYTVNDEDAITSERTSGFGSTGN